MNKSKRLHLRLSEQDYNKIKQIQSRTNKTNKTISQIIRDVIERIYKFLGCEQSCPNFIAKIQKNALHCSERVLLYNHRKGNKIIGSTIRRYLI